MKRFSPLTAHRETLYYVFLLCSNCVGSSHATQQDRVSTQVTMTGLPIMTRGKCMIVDLRTSKSSITWDDTFCDADSAQQSVTNYYKWLPDFFRQALLFAEQMACRHEKCAIKDRAVRLYVTWDRKPDISVTHGSKAMLPIRVTTALIDLVVSTMLTYLDEVRGTPDATSFRELLSRIDSQAGASCNAPPAMRRMPSAEDFRLVLQLAQVFYSFVFAHEIAHVTDGPTCGKPEGSVIEQETRCDERAFNWMTQKVTRSALPPALTTMFVMLGHYSAVFAPVLAPPMGPDSDPGLSFATSLGWIQRGQIVLRNWVQYCTTTLDDELTCHNHWQKAWNDSSALLSRTIPKQCSPDAPVVDVLISSAAPPMGTQCFGIADDDALFCSETGSECIHHRAELQREDSATTFTACQDVNAMFCGSRRWNVDGRVTAYCSSSASDCSATRARYNAKARTTEVFGCTFFSAL